MATLRKDHPHLKCIVTADSLSANAPPIAPLRAHGLHAIRRVKDGNHASLGAQGQAADQAGRVPTMRGTTVPVVIHGFLRVFRPVLPSATDRDGHSIHLLGCPHFFGLAVRLYASVWRAVSSPRDARLCGVRWVRQRLRSY